MNSKEKFIQAGISYNSLDKEIIPLLEILNFDLDLKTEYSCFGHECNEVPYIVFVKEVDDPEILALAKFLAQSNRITIANGINLDNNFGEFNKWVRNSDGEGIVINWTYTLPIIYGNAEIYEGIKTAHLVRLLDDLCDYKQQIK